MELIIDRTACDLSAAETPVWSWDAGATTDPEALREGTSLFLNLPATRVNDDLFHHAATPHGRDRFNRTLHRAELRFDDETLLEGTVRLCSCRPDDAAARYRIEIRGGAAEWARLAAQLRLNALEIPFSMKLLPTEICATWEGERDVRFLPVVFDDYRPVYSSSGLLPAQRVLSVDDYHPFIRLKTLVEAIFTRGGYSVESRFLESEFFRSLYMSGAYAERDTAAVSRRMGFFARRTADAEATANYSGRVYASPFMATHSVGNLVDALSPQALDDEGQLLSDAFSTGGYLRMEEGQLRFRPPSTVEVGFEYHLVYETEYRILSRTRLQGFDSVYLGTGADLTFELANRFADRRRNLTAGLSYRAVVFDHIEGYAYRVELPSGDSMGEFSGRSGLVSAPDSAEPGSPVVYARAADSAVWRLYVGDWALYEGYVEERGVTEVELDLRTAPETVGPSAPKSFHTLYFYGAEPGMTFRLRKSSTLKPYFSSRPGYGSRIEFADIACHAVRQSELLAALVHLFNLRIFTDEREKRVYVEPADDFYLAGDPVDWSAKQIDDGETAVEECDAERHEARLYGYRSGDGAVERFNRAEETDFGSWLVRSSSMAAMQGVEELLNPLFAPTLDEAGHFAEAPSALVPLVGDRDDTESVDNYRFTPRLLRYLGLKPLPEGERWSYPAPEGVYPFAAFHFAGDADTEGFTLCFEDRDGQSGLHRCYDREEAIGEVGRRLCTTLRLSAREAEALRHRSRNAEAGVDALFRLRIGGEPVRCRLEAVERYDPAVGAARCRFTLIDDDRP